MAILNFPSNPSTGDQYAENGVVYTWSGVSWTANGAENTDARYVQVTGDTMTGNLNVPSINGGPLAGLRNQLINGNFTIQQRGDSFTGPVNGYTFDRWAASGSLSVNATTNTPEAGQSAIEVSGGGFLGQGIELFSNAYPFVSGSTWTVSFQATQLPSNVYVNFRDGVGNTANQVVIAEIPSSSFVENPALQPANTDYKHYSASFTVSSTGAPTTKCVEMTFEFPVATIRLGNVQLEPSSVATPFEHRPIGLELSLCQRYYEEGVGEQGSNAFWSGYTQVGKQTYVIKSFMVEKRAIPTMTKVGSALVSGVDVNSAVISATTTTAKGFRAEGTGTVTSGGGYMIISWTADAEL